MLVQITVIILWLECYGLGLTLCLNTTFKEAKSVAYKEIEKTNKKL